MRDLIIVEQNNVVRYDDVSLSQLQETVESSKELFWLDLEQITDEDAAFLSDFKEFDAHPAVGQELSVFFRNAGAPASILAVDAVTVTFQH